MFLTVQAFSEIFLFLLGRGPWSTVHLWAEWFLMLGLMLTSRDHSQANPTNLLQRPGDSVIPRPTGLQSPSITLPKSLTLMARVETFPMSHSKEILNFIIKCVPKHRLPVADWTEQHQNYKLSILPTYSCYNGRDCTQSSLNINSTINYWKPKAEIIFNTKLCIQVFAR